MVIEEVLLQDNLLTGSIPASICSLRGSLVNFTTLQADCEPPTLVLGQAQINCVNGCCTACFVGRLAKRWRSPTSTPTLSPSAYCSSPIGRSNDINTVASSISSSFADGSPQAQAQSWLLSVDTATNACNGFDAIRQRYSLAVFFYSTFGSDWFVNTDWLGPQNECDWYGVECTNGLVTSLSMGEFCVVT